MAEAARLLLSQLKQRPVTLPPTVGEERPATAHKPIWEVIEEENRSIPPSSPRGQHRFNLGRTEPEVSDRPHYLATLPTTRCCWSDPGLPQPKEAPNHTPAAGDESSMLAQTPSSHLGSPPHPRAPAGAVARSSYPDERSLQSRFQETGVDRHGSRKGLRAEKEEENCQWMLRVLLCKENPAALRSLITRDDDLRCSARSAAVPFPRPRSHGLRVLCSVTASKHGPSTNGSSFACHTG